MQTAAAAQTATERWAQVQQEQYDSGGYIIWSNVKFIDTASNDVKRIVRSSACNLGNYAYRNFWLDGSSAR